MAFVCLDKTTTRLDPPWHPSGQSGKRGSRENWYPQCQPQDPTALLLVLTTITSPFLSLWPDLEFFRGPTVRMPVQPQTGSSFQVLPLFVGFGGIVGTQPRLNRGIAKLKSWASSRKQQAMCRSSWYLRAVRQAQEGSAEGQRMQFAGLAVLCAATHGWAVPYDRLFEVWRIPSISIPAHYVHHMHHVRHELVFLEGFYFGGGCGKFVWPAFKRYRIHIIGKGIAWFGSILPKSSWLRKIKKMTYFFGKG